MTLDNAKMTYKLLELSKRTGYEISQHNGQRKFGPPPGWSGSPPPKGCEVFVGKLPREIFEDELQPLFSRVGTIYEMRLMMDFSGSNRGYAFVTYTTRAEAAAAIKQLNGVEIRPGKHIGVVKSVDNCRLFIGNIPKTKTKEEIMEELSKRVDGIIDVILHKNCHDKRLNRGFAFVEFVSHRSAAMARRALVPGCVKLWGDHDVLVDWAEPEPEIDDEQMLTVKVLYVRNFSIQTTPDAIKEIFESAIDHKIEHIKKIYDYAFIHFYERQHAELAMLKLQNKEIDGSPIEIRWAKPVDREIYRIQKRNKGNAKFNNSLDLSQTLLLYKQHLEKREYANSSKDDGVSSGYAGESSSGSPSGSKPIYDHTNQTNTYCLAPAKLESICKRYMWALPVYQLRKQTDSNGADLWVCSVELPHVGQPLFNIPQCLGPLVTMPQFSVQLARNVAAELALNYITYLRVDIIQRSVIPPPPPLPPMYPPIMQTPMPGCMGVTYDYNQLYSRQPPVPALCDRLDNMRLF